MLMQTAAQCPRSQFASVTTLFGPTPHKPFAVYKKGKRMGEMAWNTKSIANFDFGTCFDNRSIEIWLKSRLSIVLVRNNLIIIVDLIKAANITLGISVDGP